MRRLFLIFTALFVIGLPMRAEEVPREKILRIGLDELAVRDTAYNQHIIDSMTKNLMEWNTLTMTMAI